MIEQILAEVESSSENQSHIKRLQHVYEYAWQFSPSTSTKVGAGIYHNTQLVAIAANELTAQARTYISEHFDTQSQYEAKRAQAWMMKNAQEALHHAEQLVFIRAHEESADVSGMQLVLPWFPCEECAYQIADNGISELITHKPMIKRTANRWHESLYEAKKILDDKGVRIITVEDTIGTYALQHGVMWKP